MGSHTYNFTMHAVILLANYFFLVSGAPEKLSEKLILSENNSNLASDGERIVGGTDANPGEFPHQVALYNNGRFFCGGSLIKEDKVLTAAHCCFGNYAINIIARVGQYRLGSIVDENQEDINVQKIIIHEDFDVNTLENDICILHLEEKAYNSSTVGLIGIPPKNKEYSPGTPCTVTGWGTIEENGPLPDVLQKVEVPLISDEACQEDYGSFEIFSSMMCAGYEEGGKDSCQGDSGGPLMCGDDLDGIVSWGIGCAQPGIPGVYTQTSHYVDWIEEHSGSNHFRCVPTIIVFAYTFLSIFQFY